MCIIHSFTPQEGKPSILKKVDSNAEILASYQAYLNDESNLGPGLADELYFPTTERQICSLLKNLSKMKKPVTISAHVQVLLEVLYL